MSRSSQDDSPLGIRLVSAPPSHYTSSTLSRRSRSFSTLAPSSPPSSYHLAPSSPPHPPSSPPGSAPASKFGSLQRGLRKMASWSTVRVLDRAGPGSHGSLSRSAGGSESEAGDSAPGSEAGRPAGHRGLGQGGWQPGEGGFGRVEGLPRWRKAAEVFKRTLRGRASVGGGLGSGGRKVSGRRGPSSGALETGRQGVEEAGDGWAGEFGEWLGRPSLGGEGLGWSEGSGSEWSEYGTAEGPSRGEWRRAATAGAFEEGG